MGSFAHMGQVCMAASRHMVHGSIADDYTAALAARADRLPARPTGGGLVHINDQTINDEANIPFGGVLDSGTALIRAAARLGLSTPAVLGLDLDRAPRAGRDPGQPLDAGGMIVQRPGGSR